MSWRRRRRRKKKKKRRKKERKIKMDSTRRMKRKRLPMAIIGPPLLLERGAAVVRRPLLKALVPALMLRMMIQVEQMTPTASAFGLASAASV
jgi:hypothetical protein